MGLEREKVADTQAEARKRLTEAALDIEAVRRQSEHSTERCPMKGAWGLEGCKLQVLAFCRLTFADGSPLSASLGQLQANLASQR